MIQAKKGSKENEKLEVLPQEITTFIDETNLRSLEQWDALFFLLEMLFFLTSHYLEELAIAAKHTGDVIVCSLQGSVKVNLTDGLSITVTWSS